MPVLEPVAVGKNGMNANCCGYGRDDENDCHTRASLLIGITEKQELRKRIFFLTSAFLFLPFLLPKVPPLIIAYAATVFRCI
jgi:hypothetical protein